MWVARERWITWSLVRLTGSAACPPSPVRPHHSPPPLRPPPSQLPSPPPRSHVQTASDRYYRTLYEFMLDPRLATSSKHALLLNLLYKALKADPSVARAQAFAKRLLQVSGGAGGFKAGMD